MEKFFKIFSNCLVDIIDVSVDILDKEIQDFKKISKDEKRLKKRKNNNIFCLLFGKRERIQFSLFYFNLSLNSSHFLLLFVPAIFSPLVLYKPALFQP